MLALPTLGLLLLALSALPSPKNLHAWETARPGVTIEFPRDHHAHPGFRTEWWYFTGNLAGPDGGRLGYQLTFFRRGLRPPGSATASSAFVRDWFAFGHFAISDLERGQFFHDQKIVRGGFGEAAFPPTGSRVAQIGNWTADRLEDDRWRIAAEAEGFSLELTLRPMRPVVLQGEAGYSQKAAGADQASIYYSLTRLATTGVIQLGDQEIPVEGNSWMDREWATNQLAEDQAGWDWFSLQGEDGSDWMVYQLRKKDGSTDPFSKGLWWPSEGEPTLVRAADFTLTPLRWWRSPDGVARYPLAWRLEMPAAALTIEVEAALDNQELQLNPIRYWEGAVTFRGTRAGQPFNGRGYLEMTGYAGTLAPLTKGE